MSGKICEECESSFEPSRTSQRYCSVRCGNRHRDRRRRHADTSATTAPNPELQNGPAAPATCQRNPDARLTAALASSIEAQDSLRTQLRTQSADIEQLEADVEEQRAVIKKLRLDVARLQSVQQADVHDLLHLAGRLLAVSQATGVELDNPTRSLFRRRGWTAAARRTEANQ